MAEFPYTTVPGKLPPLFNKIQTAGTPPVLTQKVLASFGFTSTNDRTMQRVVKAIGFVDSTGKPTERWAAFKDKSRAKTVLGAGIREGYPDLFQMYPDAYQRSDDDLRNFVNSNTTGGAQVVSYVLGTFKALCALADFSGTSTAAATVTTIPTPPPVASDVQGDQMVNSSGPLPTFARNLGTGVTLNINIQLTVPDTTDEKVYDNFFAALKKHLLS